MSQASVVCDGDTCRLVPQQPAAPAVKPKVVCRPAGAPAGAWHPLPWHHTAFVDPYERINFWSHAVPAVGLLLLGLRGWLRSETSIVLYCACAAVTHGLSALTHVFPESVALEKADHIGIVATIVGTPVSALLVHASHGLADLPAAIPLCAAGLLACAWAPPAPRTAGYVGLSAALVTACWQVLNANLLAQGVLYVIGAALFLRNGGHARWPGCADHHGLHYCVTAAAVLHLAHLRKAIGHQL